MPTVAEVLKATGFTDEQISSLDQKVLTGVKSVLDAAENEKKAGLDAVAQAEARKAEAATALQKAEAEAKRAAEVLERAEVERRSNVEFFDTKISPALNGWEQKQKELETAKANAESAAAFYKTQIEGAKAAGFLASDAPAFVLPTPAGDPPRDPQNGRYVAGAGGSGAVPGSPQFMQEIDQRLGQGLSNSMWALQNYQRLTGGQYMPDDVEVLAREASDRKMDFRAYVSQKYDFAGKQRAIQEKAQHEHDEKVRLEATAPYEAKIAEAQKKAEEAVKENDRKWAEKIGNNPEVRIAQPSRFSDIARAQKAGERADPLSMNDSQRRQATSAAIRQEITSGNAA